MSGECLRDHDFQRRFDEARDRYKQVADEGGPQAALDFALALSGPATRPDLYDPEQCQRRRQEEQGGADLSGAIATQDGSEDRRP